MERSGRVGALVLACVAAAVLSAPASTAPAPAAGPPTRATAPPRPVHAPPAARPWARPTVPAYPPQYRVGAVFSLSGRPRHHCTGSVVDSPRHDLVITAAHCVYGGAAGYRTGLAFAPGLRPDGDPAGLWRVRQALAAPRWVLGADPAADVAFLILAPRAGREIQDVVGGNPIAFDRPGDLPVQLIGYPSDEDTPVVCDGTARRRGADQLRVYCPGFSGGTSGSPWLAATAGGDARTGDGSVIGVIGGYELGGTTPQVSYSSYFDAAVRVLYEQAVAAS